MYKADLLDKKRGLDLLSTQVDFESNLKEAHLADTTDISLVHDYTRTRINNVILHIGDLEIFGLVDRPFMHKFGRQLWNDIESFEQIETRWDKSIKTPNFLPELLKSVKESGLRVRHYNNGKANRVYGYIGENFVDVDQIEFRENFLEKCREFEIIDPRETKFKVTKHGDIIEFFKINSPVGVNILFA